MRVERIGQWRFAGVGFVLMSISVAADDDIFNMSIEQLLQVKISGSTLIEQDVKRTPSAVTVFSREQIRRLGVQYVEELMNLVPGFQRYRGSGHGFTYGYSSRGRRITEGSGEILILIDGMQIHNPRSGYNANFHSRIPVASVERVEFIRGPGSALYGSNAMMGVVNIITTRFHNEARVSGGNFEQGAIDVLSAGAAGELTYDLFLHHQQDEGDEFLVRDAFNRVPVATSDPRTTGSAMIKLNWRDTHLSLRHHDNRSEDFYVLSNLANDFNVYHNWLNQVALTHDMVLGPLQSELTYFHNADVSKIDAQLLPPGALARISSPPSGDPYRAHATLASREDRLRWHNYWSLESGTLVFGVDLRRVQNTTADSVTKFDGLDVFNRRRPIRYYGEYVSVTPVENLTHRDNIAAYGQFRLYENSSGCPLDMRV